MVQKISMQFVAAVLLLLSSQILADKQDGPALAALKILNHSLATLKTLKQDNRFDTSRIKLALAQSLDDNISTTAAAEFALRDHWQRLTPPQQKIVTQYLKTSIINDYANILVASNSDLSKINIKLKPPIKRKNNKAIINFLFKFSSDSDAVDFSLRVVHNDAWKIYDISVSGVSLMKNYRARFNSQIKRMGYQKFIAKLSSRL